MKWFKRIALALLVLVVGGAAGSWWWIRSSAPAYSGELRLDGLSAPATVWFDDFGIPHIQASGRTDLYRAFGYIHASERLFQMEMLRRAGGGRLSEIIGASTLPTDIMFRTIGIPEYARQSDSLLRASGDPAMLADIQAYLDGINAFVRSGAVPREFSIIGISCEPFTTHDLFLITGAMSFSFSQAQKSEPVMDHIATHYGNRYLADIGLWHREGDSFIPGGPDTSASSALLSFGRTIQAIQQELPVAPLQGSNGWVVSGKRTANGHVLFCNDTHIGYLLPQTWYEAYLTCPGFELYGHFLGGVPFALVGRNASLSWGLTMLLNDDMDFYRETFNPQDSTQVMYKGEWTLARVRESRIAVKDQPDHVLTYRETPHGPVINDAFPDMGRETAISMLWTYTRLPNKTVEAFYGFNHAQDISEFMRSVERVHAPGLNIHYGDTAGNIAWWSAARLLERPAHVNPRILLDGASGRDEPSGYYEFRSNPRNINPSDGIIATANEWPAPMDTMYYPGYYLPPYRGARIRSQLAIRTDWNAEAMKALLTDAVNEADARALQQLLARYNRIDESGDAAREELLQVLRNWDGSYDPESVPATFFTRLQYHFLKEVCEDELGPDRFELFIKTHQVRYAYACLLDRPQSDWYDHIGTPSREHPDTLINRAFQSTFSGLSDDFGPNWKLWQWKKCSTLELRHPLGQVALFRPLFNLGPFPNQGSNETIRQGGFHLNGEGHYEVFFGSQMRIITDMGNPEECWNVTPAGQSGHIGSPHWDDQSPLYNAGEFRRQYFTAGPVEGTGSILTLVP